MSVLAPKRRSKLVYIDRSQQEIPGVVMSELTAKTPFFFCEIPVRWGDMDAYGHVNNTLYFRYFEEARFQWMLEKGLPIKSDTHPVVVTIGCTFMRPIYHPDVLRIEVFL